MLSQGSYILGVSMSKTVLGEVRRKIASKAAAQPDSPIVTVVKDVEPSVSEPELKKIDLINLVVERSGAKKKDVKPIIEATLEILGEAIASGRELNLQPFGRVKVNNTKELANAMVHSVRVRQSKNAKDSSDDASVDAAE